MNNIRKTISIAVKTALVLALVAFVGFGGVALAQQKRGKTKAAPRFVGSLNMRDATFITFINKNVGKRVYLKITFEADKEPYGYKDENADPFFSAGNYNYFLKCGEETNAPWTERCRALNYDRATKTFSGYFIVTEPKPESMKTNRMFELTPTK